MTGVIVLISGRGSNLRSLIAAGLPIARVISNRPEAAGLAYASDHGIATSVVDHRAYSDRASFDAALAQEIDRTAARLVVLAGFMRVLTATFVERYSGRLINIHPSLLPAFGGLHTHRRALEAGVKVHGATVHFVTPELDHGPIIIQAAVSVHADDDEDRLAARVLAQEHIILPRAVQWFLDGKLVTDGDRVRVTGVDSPLHWGG